MAKSTKKRGKKFFNRWWQSNNNRITKVSIIVGIVSGLAGIIATIIALFPGNDGNHIKDYFKNVTAIKLTGPIPLANLSQTDSGRIYLNNQSGSPTDLIADLYDFKLVTATARNTPCKKALETISIVKKQLSEYLSIQSYAIFGDTIRTASDMKQYLDAYDLSILALYGKPQEVKKATNQLNLFIEYSEGNAIHSDYITIIHKGNIYLIHGNEVSAPQLTYAILDQIVAKETYNPKKVLTDLALYKMASDVSLAEKHRKLPVNCDPNRSLATR